MEITISKIVQTNDGEAGPACLGLTNRMGNV